MSRNVVYRNGNYLVMLDPDSGTKIRYNSGDKFVPEFPESMDVCISKKCNVGCQFCFVAGTKILMGDLTYKNIEDVQIGDIVMGFEEKPSTQGGRRKSFPTKVINTFVHVESELINVTTDSGHTITSTPNHPFLSEGTGKNHARIFNQIGRLSIGKHLFECGFPIDYINYDSMQYKLGYTVGSWLGDGCYQHYIDKNGYDAYICRFVTKDDEINDMVYECSKPFINDLYRLDFKMKGQKDVKSSIRSNKRESYETLVALEQNNIGTNTSKEYACGFLAGFCDSEGHVDNQRSIIRLFNTNMKYIDEIVRCLEILGIDYVIEERHTNNTNPKYKDCFVARIKGKYDASKFMWYARPVCKRKSLENYISKNFQHHKQKIVNMETIEKKQYVYNLETECHTYIANNFFVHNCHEKCTPDGKHADLMNLKFIDNLHPYTELALNGNDPLHPDLVPFLEKCKELKLVPSLTVNHHTFNKNIEFLKFLCDKKLIYGLGVSIDGVYNDGKENVDNMISRFKMFPNLVLHVINGIISVEDLKLLKGNDLKVLILGYKQFGRGVDFFGYNGLGVLCSQNDLYNKLPEIVDDEWFDVVSFDNLAIEQLEPQRLMSDEEWDKMYMGDDGTHTFYIDAVNGQFSKSSTSTKRYELTNNVVDMFNVIRNES